MSKSPVTDRLKGLKKNFFYKEFVVLTSIVLISILANIFYVEWRFGGLLNYDENMARKHDIRSELRVNHYNGTTSWFALEEISFINSNNPDIGITIQTYWFIKSDVNLNATFSQAYIVVYIPEDVYTYINEIECSWKVKDTTGLDKRSEGGFKPNGVDYIKNIDISKFMLGEDVPNLVENKVTLYSR